MMASGSLRLSLFFISMIVSESMSMAPPSNSCTMRSLGASALRRVAMEASAREANDQIVDLMGILWLEHINLVVPSEKIAEYFYQDFLGLTRDPDARFHCNLGQQQFHLAETGDPAQVISGSIGLVVPSLSSLRSRLDDAMVQLKDTQFQIIENDPKAHHMTISCPFGNVVHIYDLDGDQQQSSESDSPQKMVKLHAKGGPYSHSRIGVRGKPGIRYIEISCNPGTAAGIGRFYEEILGCTVHKFNNGDDGGVNSVVVSVGPGVHLIFCEAMHQLDCLRTEQMKGVHICIYTQDFRALYKRLESRGIIWTNPRFTHLDSCDTLEDAISSRTLRFKDIVNPDTGEKILELEHETRSLRHGQYMKVPLYMTR